MTVSSLSSNYGGRLADLCIVPSFSSASETAWGMEFGNSPNVCAGVITLMQLFISFILSTAGSKKSDSDFGTTLFVDLLSISTVDEAEAVVADAVILFKQWLDENNLRDEEVYNDDEILDTIDTTVSSYTGTFLNIKVEMTTLAGDSLVVLLPIPLAIG